MLTKDLATTLEDYLDKHIEEFLKILQEIVSIETPAHGNLDNMDRCAGYLQSLFEGLGCSAKRIKSEEAGDHLVIRAPFKGKDKILLIGHYDTVFPVGTINGMPYRIEGNKVLGPGVADMKGGIVQIYYAIKALFDLKLIPKNEIVVVLTSDEEGGSKTSKELIMKEATNSKYSLILEPGFPDINLTKTSRFARGVYQIEAFGIASHAGNCPEKGINAIEVLLSTKRSIDKWNNIEKGSTCTVISINGGNPGASVVPDYATMKLDVRAKDNLLAETIDVGIKALETIQNEVKILITGEIEKPAMEFDVKNARLFNLAKEIASNFDINLIGRTVRGGSDGNFSFSAGSPTLDGLGMSGDNLHNTNEYLVLNGISKRTALLAGLLLSL